MWAGVGPVDVGVVVVGGLVSWVLVVGVVGWGGCLWWWLGVVGVGLLVCPGCLTNECVGVCH